MAQDRNLLRVLVNMVMDFQVEYSVGKFFSVQVIGSFSRTQLHVVRYIDSYTT
jgi:hypothetical protein